MTLRADLEADLADIFSDSEGAATTAIVEPLSGLPSWPLDGILRSPYRPVNMGPMEVGSQGFRFLCRTLDRSAGSLRRGDILTIDGADYRLTDPQDGNPTAGMSTLQLAPL